MAWMSADSLTDLCFDEKSRLQSAVRKRVRRCAARAECLRYQQMDKLFTVGDSRRYVNTAEKKG